MPQKKLVTSAEAAKMLKVSLRTIQLWVEKGALAAWKTPGGHRRIPVDAVEKLLDQQKAKTNVLNNPTPLKVLIVEDDPRQRKMYRKLLSRWNDDIELEMAEDGFQGLIQLGSFNPDLLITDLMMPAMDGFEMIRAINEQTSHKSLNIVVITAMDQSEPKLNKLHDLGVGILFKPILMHQLAAIIDGALADHN